MRRDEIQAVYSEGVDAVVSLVERLFSIIETQRLDIEVLKTQVKDLQQRLAMTSSNSSKPPSSDGFNKQTRSLRKKSKKKRGGQKGHPGSRLALRELPDSTLLHHPQSCSSCGRSLAEVLPRILDERRQVFDLPPLSVEVTEHRISKKSCPGCRSETLGEFPLDVQKGVSYGSRIKGFLLYLHKGQLIPSRRSCQIVEDLFSQAVSEGTLQTITREGSKELEEGCELIKAAITRAEVVNFDETGIYVEKHRDWLHSSSTNRLTYYAVDSQRGREAIERIGILPRFAGIACHDALASYLSYWCQHALCNAHHLRELTFLQEVQSRIWAGEMKRLLVSIKRAVERARAKRKTALSKSTQTRFVNAYQAILQRGFEREQQELMPRQPRGKRGRKKQSKAKNLLDRLCKYQEETLRFMRDFRVPFDNNLAERDLRMMKVQQKISGCFRTKEGATDFCRIRSYISTMKKQGHNLLEALRSVFAGNPILPDTG